MKQPAIKIDSAPSSASTFGREDCSTDDDSRDLSVDDNYFEKKRSTGNRRRGMDVSRDDCSTDDDSLDLSVDDNYFEKKRSTGNRRGRRKREKNRIDRRGMDVKRMMTPVVKVLLFGVLLSFLDVLYIMKHLEESSEISTQNASISSTAQTPSSTANAKTDNKQSKNQSSGSQISPGDKIKSGDKQIENQSASSDLLADRGPIIKLIRDAGISFDPVEDADLIEELPKWSEVVEMYGPEPVIYGLNEGNCERFQAHSDRGEHFIGTAGTFNSGTNLMSELLLGNCMMPDRMKKYGENSRGIRWQVPWGKHSPAGDKEWRESHKTMKDKLVDAREIMPIVTIRDPLIWLKSMCRHKYTVHWAGFEDAEQCPNFHRGHLGVRVKYDGFFRGHDSLVHFYNDWYGEYKDIDIPFLLVRFEDLVFHPEETITKVCECGGGKRIGKRFRYIVNTAKKGVYAHGSMKERTGYVDALVRYSTLEKRYKGYNSSADLEYIKKNIDDDLMEMMQYSAIDPNWKSKHSIPK